MSDWLDRGSVGCREEAEENDEVAGQAICDSQATDVGAVAAVKANKDAPRVDGQTLGEFEADLENQLYKIWNRMSSGSYLPPGESRRDPQAARRRVRTLGVS